MSTAGDKNLQRPCTTYWETVRGEIKKISSVTVARTGARVYYYVRGNSERRLDFKKIGRPPAQPPPSLRVAFQSATMATMATATATAGRSAVRVAYVVSEEGQFAEASATFASRKNARRCRVLLGAVPVRTTPIQGTLREVVEDLLEQAHETLFATKGRTGGRTTGGSGVLGFGLGSRASPSWDEGGGERRETATDVAVEALRRGLGGDVHYLLVDAQSLGLSALNGFPGACHDSALCKLGAGGLWDLVSRHADRRAELRLALGVRCLRTGESWVIEETMSGTVVEPRGIAPGRCLAWSVFLKDGEKKTLAEMRLDELVATSHRSAALGRFIQFAAERQNVTLTSVDAPSPWLSSDVPLDVLERNDDPNAALLRAMAPRLERSANFEARERATATETTAPSKVTKKQSDGDDAHGAIDDDTMLRHTQREEPAQATVATGWERVRQELTEPFMRQLRNVARRKRDRAAAKKRRIAAKEMRLREENMRKRQMVERD